MNSQTTFLITSILAFALLANVSVSVPVFATGGLDDEEEEEAIEQLQNQVNEINNSIEAISLNLTSGPNNIQANCPDVEEIVQEVVQNITEGQENNITEQPAECPIVQEPAVQNVTEPTISNQTIVPLPVEQNITEQGCQPIPEPEVQNETSELEPIICPVNGELLGYTNTTSGEQLPISAGENGTIPFLPPIEIPTEPELKQTNQTTVTPQEPNCNNVTEQQTVPTIINNGTTLQDEQEIATIEFEASCGCFVVDKSPEEVQ